MQTPQAFEDRALPSDESEHFVNRDPFYRSLAIFNRQFNRKIKLETGAHVKQNSTDCETTIYLNITETHFKDVVEDLGEYHGKRHYRMACGHERSNSKGEIPKAAPCWRCAEKQMYLGFSHELQHVLWKSSPLTMQSFATAYAEDVAKKSPGIDTTKLSKFIYKMGNVLDDLRINSLDERFHYGTAMGLWQRWEHFTHIAEKQDPDNFLQFMFARHFDLPLDPNHIFAKYAPLIKQATTDVRGKGLPRMLQILKRLLDGVIDAIVEPAPPQPPQQPPPQQAPNPQPTQMPGMGQPNAAASNQPPTPGGSPGGSAPPPQNTPNQPPQAQQPPPTPPSPPPGAQDIAKGLTQMMDGANPIDPDEQHADWDLLKALARTDPSLMAQALQLAAIAMGGQVLPDLDEDEVDPDLQDVVDILSNPQQVDAESNLTSNAKAKLTLIDVRPSGITQVADPLNPQERMAVEKMRAQFQRALGKAKTQHDPSGISIDVDAFIQHLIARSNPEVFNQDDQTQGFQYSTLCDMSGSMVSCFTQVIRAVEMLKAALKFPFVKGDLWGFRGASGAKGNTTGEVWLYRYDKNCKGYYGQGEAQRDGYTMKFPVQCEGLTPMNSAIHVVTNHLIAKPRGNAKRMFLLTDGSPYNTTVKGRGLGEKKLRGFVAKEVVRARKTGIEVYTIIIGNGIPDDDALFMFGPRSNWQRASEKTVEKALTDLVIQNFTRYLKDRG